MFFLRIYEPTSATDSINLNLSCDYLLMLAPTLDGMQVKHICLWYTLIASISFKMSLNINMLTV